MVPNYDYGPHRVPIQHQKASPQRTRPPRAHSMSPHAPPLGLTIIFLIIAAMDTIESYKSQLEQVQSLLEDDPGNFQFLKLRDDIQKLIALTSELVSSSNQETEELGNKNDGCDSSDDLDDAFNESVPDFVAGKIAVGDAVEVFGGERPFAAVVTGYVEDKNEYKLKYFEYDVEVSLPTHTVRLIAPGSLKRADINVGMKVQCKFAQDQRWYNAEIINLTSHGAIVSYTQYGNSEEVPFEYLRSLQQFKKKEEQPTNTLLKIPENLKILPTDTEEEKLRKKKKIKAIKSKNRIVSKEQEVTAVQNTWKKFVSKTTKKPMSGMVKSSMFASPDAVEGKVGVVNSGKGLTDFMTRTKHKFS